MSIEACPDPGRDLSRGTLAIHALPETAEPGSRPLNDVGMPLAAAPVTFSSVGCRYTRGIEMRGTLSDIVMAWGGGAQQPESVPER